MTDSSFCNGKHIVHLKNNYCNGNYFSAMEIIFPQWKLFSAMGSLFCTGKDFFLLYKVWKVFPIVESIFWKRVPMIKNISYGLLQ